MRVAERQLFFRYTYLRDICSIYLLNNLILLEGLIKNVEIDESVSFKRKYNVGQLSDYNFS